jgi:hypothetical protein
VSRLFGNQPKVSPQERVRDFARVQVRAGLLDPAAQQAEVETAVAAELPGEDPASTARALLAEEQAVLAAEQTAWSRPTDHDRLQAAFDTLTKRGLVVLQAVDDHWVAAGELRRLAAAGTPPEGVVWFTAPDVWHAVDHGMLELNVWHADTANVAPGDRLLDVVVEALADHGLAGHFDEGRVEVAASWHKVLA